MVKESSTFETLANAFRYNSGKDFMDSGGENGRHWQKPALEKKPFCGVIDCDYGEISGTIESAYFLSEWGEVDQDIQSRFEKWAKQPENSKLNWFEAGDKFCFEELKLHNHARDNIYNSDNDFSQVFVWEVWSPIEHESDWTYCDEPLTVIYAHTGADVRGGYSYPVFMRPSDWEYSAPMRTVCGFYADEGRKDGESLETEALQDLSESWSYCYSSWPSGELNEDVKRIFGHTRTKDTVCVQLNGGEIVKVVLEVPLEF